MKRYVFCILLGAFGIVRGQDISTFSTRSVLPKSTIFFRNPAVLKAEPSFQFGNVSLPAPFNNIRHFYAAVSNLSFFPDSAHCIGGYVLSNAQGEVLTEMALKVNYHYRVPLNSQMDLALGAQLGGYQLRVRPTSVTEGANDFQPNLDVFGATKWKHLVLGASFSNITQPNVTLFTESLDYRRLYGVFVDWQFLRREKVGAAFSLVSHVQDAQAEYVAVLESVLVSSWVVGAHLGNVTQGFYAGIESLPLKNLRLSIKLGYQRSQSDTGAPGYTRIHVHFGLN